MQLRIDNDEIVEAVIALVQQTIADMTVKQVTFTRKKGGEVYADVEVELTG